MSAVGDQSVLAGDRLVMLICGLHLTQDGTRGVTMKRRSDALSERGRLIAAALPACTGALSKSVCQLPWRPRSSRVSMGIKNTTDTERMPVSVQSIGGSLALSTSAWMAPWLHTSETKTAPSTDHDEKSKMVVLW